MSQIEELRQLIVGGEAEQLAELKDRIEDLEKRTSDVAEVLPPAITEGFKKGGAQLIDALEKPVSLGLKQAIRAEPEEYAEILYPVMAPAIRRAISQAISSLLATINRTISSTTSIQGIRSRFESVWTGVPYAELALRHSLIYKVEHVYLIERASGIKIDEVASQESSSLDSDAVSAMFSAIQSFVQDSFSHDKTEMLTDLKVGSYNVWLAHGPSIMLACVINGDAPEGLKDDLYDSLYKIRTRYANPIASFDGDLSQFENVQDFMDPLLQLRLKEGSVEQAKNGSGKVANVFFPLLLFLMVIAVAYYFFDRSSKLSSVEYVLRDTPGIAATDLYWRDGKIVIEGLQDPDAKVPYSTFTAYGLDADSLVLKTIPFRSLDLDMELLRFREEFTLANGVTLDKSDSEVFLAGQAPISWLEKNSNRIKQLSADNRLNIVELSASIDSVKAELAIILSESELASLNYIKSQQEVGYVIRIEGQIEGDKLSLITTQFANNVWVDVAISLAENNSSTPVVKAN